MARVEALSIVDALAAELRQRVFSGDLTHSDALTEAEVARTYEVARPTAKAAIEKLVGEGLLQRSAHKTARVLQRVPTTCATSTAPEPASSPRCSGNSPATTWFPRTRWPRTARSRRSPTVPRYPSSNPTCGSTPHSSTRRSPRTSRIFRTLVSEVRLCMVQVQGKHLLTTSSIVAEHRQILEALADGDGERAVAVLTGTCPGPASGWPRHSAANRTRKRRHPIRPRSRGAASRTPSPCASATRSRRPESAPPAPRSECCRPIGGTHLQAVHPGGASLPRPLPPRVDRVLRRQRRGPPHAVVDPHLDLLDAAVLRPCGPRDDRGAGRNLPERGGHVDARRGLDRCLRRPAASGPIRLGAVEAVSSQSTTHLVADTNPYSPGTTDAPDSRARTGAVRRSSRPRGSRRGRRAGPRPGCRP